MKNLKSSISVIHFLFTCWNFPVANLFRCCFFFFFAFWNFCFAPVINCYKYLFRLNMIKCVFQLFFFFRYLRRTSLKIHSAHSWVHSLEACHKVIQWLFYVSHSQWVLSYFIFLFPHYCQIPCTYLLLTLKFVFFFH